MLGNGKVATTIFNKLTYSNFFVPWSREVKISRSNFGFFKANDVDSFTFLRNAIIRCIQYPIFNFISELVKCRNYGFKSFSLIVSQQSRYIFQEERSWFMMINNPCNIVKERALGFMFKTLAFPNRTKRLTRESGKQNIKLGNFRSLNFCYISVWNFTKICFIGFLSIFVPFATEDAGGSGGFKS